MKTTEMKKKLFNKLQDEQTYFTMSDISIKKVNKNKYTITIEGLEPFSFIMKFENDEYFGYIVSISKYYKNEYDGNIVFEDSKKGYDIENALIELGYYIATRF